MIREGKNSIKERGANTDYELQRKACSRYQSGRKVNQGGGEKNQNRQVYWVNINGRANAGATIPQLSRNQEEVIEKRRGRKPMVNRTLGMGTTEIQKLATLRES